MTPIRRPQRVPPTRHMPHHPPLLPLPPHLRQRTTPNPHRRVPVPQERMVQRDDRRRMAHQQQPVALTLPVLLREAPLDLGDEDGEQPGGAVVHLGDGLAVPRGVPDGVPGGVDLGEPGAEGGGGDGAGVQAGAGFDGGVPFAEAWWGM